MKLYIYSIYTVSTLYIHYIYSIYTLYMHYIYTIYTLYMHYIYVIYTLHIHYRNILSKYHYNLQFTLKRIRFNRQYILCINSINKVNRETIKYFSKGYIFLFLFRYVNSLYVLSKFYILHYISVSIMNQACVIYINIVFNIINIVQKVLLYNIYYS